MKTTYNSTSVVCLIVALKKHDHRKVKKFQKKLDVRLQITPWPWVGDLFRCIKICSSVEKTAWHFGTFPGTLATACGLTSMVLWARRQADVATNEWFNQISGVCSMCQSAYMLHSSAITLAAKRNFLTLTGRISKPKPLIKPSLVISFKIHLYLLAPLEWGQLYFCCFCPASAAMSYLNTSNSVRQRFSPKKYTFHFCIG